VNDNPQATSVRHRDRVIAALHHEALDRCPMQISFTPEFSVRLRATSRRASLPGLAPQP